MLCCRKFQHILWPTIATHSRFPASASHHFCSQQSSHTASSTCKQEFTAKELQKKPVPLKSISIDDLGFAILHPEANKQMRKMVLFAKFCSLGSSAMALIMIPVLTSSFWEPMKERPGFLVFAGVANLFFVVFSLTPVLLHFITKRFVREVYYNPKTQIFTTVHFNFFLQKRALQFTADQLVDACDIPADAKVWSTSFATCLVHSYPMLLLLDPQFYSDESVYRQLTKNIKPPAESERKKNQEENGRN